MFLNVHLGSLGSSANNIAVIIIAATTTTTTAVTAAATTTTAAATAAATATASAVAIVTKYQAYYLQTAIPNDFMTSSLSKLSMLNPIDRI